MKIIKFAISDADFELSDRYNYTDEERDRYIAELRSQCREDIRINDIKAAKSRLWAKEFIVC